MDRETNKGQQKDSACLAIHKSEDSLARANPRIRARANQSQQKSYLDLPTDSLRSFSQGRLRVALTWAVCLTRESNVSAKA